MCGVYRQLRLIAISIPDTMQHINRTVVTNLEDGWDELGSSMDDILRGHLTHTEVLVPVITICTDLLDTHTTHHYYPVANLYCAKVLEINTSIN